MSRKVAFYDLAVNDESVRQELLRAVEAVFKHGRLIEGPEVKELESRVAAACGRRFAVGVGSGSDALLIALMSLGIGQNAGDEVITTPLSAIATANAIALAGALPVFADIGDDLNIDPASVEALITPRTRAIMPVHYTGRICRMEELMRIAESRGLPIVEDAAQAYGAMRGGKLAGSFGLISCLSLNPMKVFAACGEAGMILTDRADLHERAAALRYNGLVNRDECIQASINGRLDTLQAAILLSRMKDVDAIIRKRRSHAAWYGEALGDVVTVPQETAGAHDSYYTYIIGAKKRDELKAFLETRGIETRIQYPRLMPDQPAFRGKFRGTFPCARKLVGEVLCLPIHEKLIQADLEYVSKAIHEFYA